MNKAFSLLVIVAMFLAVTVYARHPNTRWHELKAKKYDFKQYAQEFNKPYKNSVDSHEYKLRKVIFDNNLKTILAHNEGPSSYKMGVNHLTDLSKDEIRSQNGMHKSSLVSAAEPALSHQLTDLPVSVDWRDRGAVTAVKDQGRCGSCWAFASTETLESHAFLETSFLMDLSPQQIASCAENTEKCGGTGGCNGATADVALAYVQKHGITTEWIDPYTSYAGEDFKCRQGSAYNTSAVRIHDWKHIKSNSLPDTLVALNKVGPLIATVAADTWALYEEGIFDGCDTSKSVTLDHAVQLVGYGEDAKTGEKYFTIRNSWSPLWGEHGYIRLKRREEEVCGFDSNPADGEGCPGGPSNITVCGTCGILYDSVYPLQTKLHLA